MSKRISPEAAVMHFFETADYAVAASIFNLVAAKMKDRKAKNAPIKTTTPRALKVDRAAKTDATGLKNASPSSTPSSEPEIVQ